MSKTLRELADGITEISIELLQYLDYTNSKGSPKTFKEAQDAISGGVDRYRNDAFFRAKVMMMVSKVMGVVGKHHDDAILALLDERDALKADAARYRAIRSGLEVDENSGIVVSLIDDFGGSTLRNEHADESIDAAMEPSHEL
jgi:chorismate mutase